MIEVRNLRIALAACGGTPEGEAAVRRARAFRVLGLHEGERARVELLKRSIDARKQQVHLVESVAVDLFDATREARILARRGGQNVLPHMPRIPAWPSAPRHASAKRPIVVGAGVAGIFCALALAHAGLEPILVEKGPATALRREAIEQFRATGELDEHANVQFGLGGAGAFTDGKLSTGTRSPHHALILRALVEAGAEERILFDAKPHVGSDVLPHVVETLIESLRALGGELRLETSLVGLATTGHGASRRLSSATFSHAGVEERLPAEHLVLATGHSARDVFSLLSASGIALEAKPFAVGVRIEHPQAEVDRALYGSAAGNPLLGAAPYQIARKAPGGLRCFSFCMCPGGQVVAASSEAGGVVTNGASLAARDGANANAALLVNVGGPEAYPTDPLAGIEHQRALERAAFELGGATYAAPAQLVGDFLEGRASTGAGSVAPSYPRGVVWTSLDEILPEGVASCLRGALPLMARSLPFFANPEAPMSAPESRSSSPVRIPRTEDGQSTSVAGLYPVGEGAGWAGGIMSAAADGMRAAHAIIASLDEHA